MDVFESFRSAADPSKAVQMRSYMRNQFPFLGIQTPQRTKLSAPFLKAMAKEPVNWGFVDRCWDEPEREFQYLAIAYLERISQRLTGDDILQLKRLITAKSWWDTVDGLDGIVGDVAFRYPEVNEILLKWSMDENIWLRRTAIDHQLQRKEKTNTRLLEEILTNNLDQTEFFVNKAVGWSLREYSKTDPDWVRSFLERHQAHMAPLSIAEAKKYI